MIKTIHYHTDEIEVSLDSKEWKTVKTLDFVKDGFKLNIIEIIVHADLIIRPEDTKGFLGIFIDDEKQPRAVIESDLTFSHIFQTEFETYNIPLGKHTIKIKVKSEQGYPVVNTFLEIHFTRFYNIYEMLGLLVPIELLS